MTKSKARSDGGLTVLCSHLSESRRTPLTHSGSSMPEPSRVTLTAGETTVEVFLCAACAEDSPATGKPSPFLATENRRALEMATLRILRKDLEARLEVVISGIGELRHLLRHPL